MNDPEVAILHNDAALHSLKRPQLHALVRRFGLKGSGKNTDLVARLQEHGRLIVERGWDRSSAEPDDASTASWAIVDGATMPVAEDLEELGVRGPGSAHSTLTGSISSTSLASTIREKGATLLRVLVDPSRRDVEPQPAPVDPAPPADKLVPLNDVAMSDDDDQSSAAEDEDDGGIRLVSSRSTVADTTMASLDSPPPFLPPTTPAFVFGSPSTSAAPHASTFTFSSTMPGTLFASTSSTSSALADQPPVAAVAPALSPMDSILAEMNRRAAESRATAPLPRSGSTLFGSASTRPASPSKGTKAAFDLNHKRRFDKMDSITTHWAAKRALPASTSSSSVSGDLAGTARSGSSRSISVAAAGAADAPERAPKRLKPSTSRPFGLSRLASSTATSSSASTSTSAASDQKLVAALRDDGWSAALAPKGAVSLSASIRTAAQPARGGGSGGLKGVREDILPREERERAQKKRQMELAKARRKSGAASGVGLGRRRPSLGVGPTKSSGSTASRLFKSAVRKFTTSSSSSSTSTRPPVPPLPTSSSLHALAPSASSRTLATPSTSALPRFASSTAASASRTALLPASPPKKAQAPPQPQLGRKKFDLQASLQRPMSWRPHLGATAASPAAGAPASSPAVVRPSAAFAAPASAARRPVGSLQRTASTRVANHALLSPVRPAPAVVERPASVEDQLAALPLAPSTPFGAPIQTVTNVVEAGAAAAVTSAAPSSGWLPPAVTKKPVLPAASSSSSTTATTATASASSSTSTARPEAALKKKLVSSSTRTARAPEKARGKAQVEGLESRVRKVRATAAASASAKGKGKSSARAE
ncbi:hypothetical protein JCM9279_004863 [Rhodotorula babjevae]